MILRQCGQLRFDFDPFGRFVEREGLPDDRADLCLVHTPEPRRCSGRIRTDDLRHMRPAGTTEFPTQQWCARRPAVARRPGSCNARAVVGMVRAQDRRGRGELAYSLGGVSQTPSTRHASAQNGASVSSATCGCVARRDRNHSANTKNTTAALAHLSCGRDLRWVARSRAHCNQSAARHLPACTTVSGTTGSVSESLAKRNDR